MNSDRKKIILAIIVFIVTFLVFREVFSHWNELEGWLLGK